VTRPCTQSLQKQRQHRHNQKLKHAHKKPEDAYKGERDQFLMLHADAREEAELAAALAGAKP
jgi:hypothetical protein